MTKIFWFYIGYMLDSFSLRAQHWETTGIAQATWAHSVFPGPLFTKRLTYRKNSLSLEAARFWFRLFQSLWNLTGISAAALPRGLWNFRAIRSLKHPISRLRYFKRSRGKTTACLVNRGPEFSADLGKNGLYLDQLITRDNTVLLPPG